MKYAKIKYHDIANGLGLEPACLYLDVPTDAKDVSMRSRGILIMGKNLRKAP